MCFMSGFCFFFFKQKTAYEMRISDWSSDVCSSDLIGAGFDEREVRRPEPRFDVALEKARQKDLQVVFEIGERDFFGDVQAFHLVEHRAVRAIGVDAVDAPRTDAADRRLALPHRADLHRRGIDRKSVVYGKSVSVT